MMMMMMVVMMMIVPFAEQLNEIVTNDRARFAIISVVRGRAAYTD